LRVPVSVLNPFISRYRAIASSISTGCGPDPAQASRISRRDEGACWVAEAALGDPVIDIISSENENNENENERFGISATPLNWRPPRGRTHRSVNGIVGIFRDVKGVSNICIEIQFFTPEAAHLARSRICWALIQECS
jgi:hypothetical protein